MKIKIKVISGPYKGMWWCGRDSKGRSLQVCDGILTFDEKEAKVFTKFPGSLYHKRTDRLVHVWDKEE